MVRGLSSISAVHAGGYHSAAIHTSGALWAWGNNTYGQLGLGGVSAVSATPRLVRGLSGVRSVSAGYVHTSAVTADGAVWNWGRMPGRASGLPAKVWGFAIPIRSVAAGSDFTLALGSNGAVYSWGGNKSGQAGIGRLSDTVLNPVRLPGLDSILALAAGHAHALALRSDGSLWAWGSNKEGQLATTSGDGTLARKVAGLPTPLGGAGSIRAIIAGTFNSAVVYADGSVWMWGSNASGQFGNGTLLGSAVPVKLNTLAGVAAVSVGQGFVSVLKKDGTVFGMGANPAGQLGNNTAVDTRTPVQVVGLSGFGYLKLGASPAP